MEKDLEVKKKKWKISEGIRRVAGLETLQQTANWNLSHKVSRSCGSILQELIFCEEPSPRRSCAHSHILISLCTLGNSEPKTACQSDRNIRATSWLPPPPRSTCPWGNKWKACFRNTRLRKTAFQLHLFLCCAKSTLTGFDPKQGQLRTLRFLQPLAALPTPSTFNFNYVGTGPGPGAAARFSWPSLGGPMLWPRIFPKSLCRIARSLPILHFLFGQIPSCLTRVRLRLLFFLYAGTSSPCNPTACHSFM